MTSEDLDTWTDTELLQQVETRLPEGTEFWFGEDDQSWVAKITRTSNEEVLWQASDLTLRGVLFRAFHHLWVPPQQQGVWTVQPARPTLQAVAQRISEKYADPEDLDPSEVASVYSSDT